MSDAYPPWGLLTQSRALQTLDYTKEPYRRVICPVGDGR